MLNPQINVEPTNSVVISSNVWMCVDGIICMIVDLDVRVKWTTSSIEARFFNRGCTIVFIDKSHGFPPDNLDFQTRKLQH